VLKNLKGKNILVTSGGTQEYVDDVRVLTNTSSGKLGATIANQLYQNGAKVYYVCGKNSVLPCNIEPDQGFVVRTAEDALEAMKMIILNQGNDIHAVVHAMAVSDFTFKRSKSVKCKSSDPEAFIEYMRQTITTNPKIISQIKTWKKDLILIGFKFEVGVPLTHLVTLARESIQKNGCDMVVINDKKEMEKTGKHLARFVTPTDTSSISKIEVYEGKTAIAKGIKKYLKSVL
jgi:phosphopantothenoylcysteine synthetase/decarboxylase